MKKFSLILLLQTLLNCVSAQSDELPLTFSETYEYLLLNGEQCKKTILTDFTGNEPLEIIIWSTETNNNGFKRILTLGIVDDYTLREITIQRFDDLGNLVLEIDSANSQLKSRKQLEYEDGKLKRTKKSDKSTTSNTTFFYEDDKLIKELKTEQGGLFSTDENLYTTIYNYNELNQVSIEFHLSNSDTIDITKHSYDKEGQIIKSISDDSIQTWKYDEEGNIVEEFIQAINLSLRKTYSYDKSNRLVKKLTYRNK